MTCKASHITVLKFGGSVLRSERDLPGAVHEIYRWVRKGRRVVAVVSAFQGRTDALLAEASSIDECSSWGATAVLAATGELTAAAKLGLSLDAVGLRARVMLPDAIGLRARGNPLEAHLIELNCKAVLGALEDTQVVVVPGFIAVNETGALVLLGRGGSDQSALFIAQKLGAGQCRLLKDVPGVLERDPDEPGPTPRCYEQVSWTTADKTGGRIVQRWSNAFAVQNRLSYEIAPLHSADATIVGSGPDRLRPSDETKSRPWRVALLGAGTVGLGVYERLMQLPEHFEVVTVACRDFVRAVRNGIDPALLTKDPIRAATTSCDIVVELLGGLDPATPAVEAALRLGDRHVVTANKSLVAQHGPRLRQLAWSNRRRLLFNAAVGGSTPALELIELLRQSGPIRAIEGVLNGTANFILDRLWRHDRLRGFGFETELAEAQRRGLTEADPSRDLDGEDALDKLTILTWAAFDAPLDRSSVVRDKLNKLSAEQWFIKLEPAWSLRQVARVEKKGQAIVASVRLSPVPPNHPLHNLHEEDNCVVVETDSGTHQTSGKGAGRRPTAEAVLADLLEITRTRGPVPATRTAEDHPHTLST